MWILAQLLTEITRTSRQKMVAGVDFEWSSQSWTHNIFRVYELLFWRRMNGKGTQRAQISCEWKNDATGFHIEYRAHTWEGSCSLVEQYVRLALAQWKFVPFRVTVPMLQTNTGFPIFASPYLFAIAYDVDTGSAVGSATTPVTWSHTITGSNTYLVAGGQENNVTQTENGATANSVTMTLINTVTITASRYGTMYGLKAPTTGTISLALTGNPVNWYNGSSVSYTGVSQTSSTPDSNNTGSSVSATSITVATTTVADNCILVGSFDGGGGTGTASTNTEQLVNHGSYNEPTLYQNSSLTPRSPAGSYSLVVTHSVSGDSLIVASLAPSAAAAGATRPLLLSLLGVT